MSVATHDKEYQLHRLVQESHKTNSTTTNKKATNINGRFLETGNLIFRVITLHDLNVQFLTKITRHNKTKVWIIQRRKSNQEKLLLRKPRYWAY